MIAEQKIAQTLFCNVECEQLLDFVIFGNAGTHFGKGDIKASEKAEFTMWVGDVIGGTETIFFVDVLCRDASLLVQFSAHGGKRVGLTCGIAVALPFKKTSDDVISSLMNGGLPTSLIEDKAVRRFHH